MMRRLGPAVAAVAILASLAVVSHVARDYDDAEIATYPRNGQIR